MSTTIEDILNEYGIKKSTAPDTHEIRWGATCSECGAKKEGNLGALPEPGYATKWFWRRGWNMSKKHAPICKNCAQEARKDTKKAVPAPAVPVPAAPVPAVPVPAVPVVNFKLMRRVTEKLYEVFDEPKRVYTDGWSDKRVAEETDTSMLFVEHLRREAFGELAQDPAITELLQTIAKIRKDQTEGLDLVRMVYDDEVQKIKDGIEARLASAERQLTAMVGRK